MPIAVKQEEPGLWPELIQQAVANTRFEKLRAKEEEEGGFRERPDGCERFFRSGRSGEGREPQWCPSLNALQRPSAVLSRCRWEAAENVVGTGF